MKLIAPSYYKSFKCIGGECKHNCCIGWEIDIDEKTKAYYKSLEGEMGRRMHQSIEENGETAYFRLVERERCPFLNSDNLCDIILTLGEDKLCQICSDHPRYRNFYSDRTEIGIGLCCETAAELIIENEAKNKLIILEDDEKVSELDEEDKIFFETRDKIFALIQDRGKNIEERIEALFNEFSISSVGLGALDWVDKYLSLEILDSGWKNVLNKIKELSKEPKPKGVAAEQILVYFIYRHLADGMYDGSFEQRIRFALLSLNMIFASELASGLAGGGAD